ncbi:MAG: pyridoxal phosphate-dependent aminotransferase [Gemmatimonas sp.]|jgi:aromatic-amino-acid transaminase|uniref:pyridoxal phosphate-dependent aminotransferase n=1 Tax=Gemmatimonas sp. TaxID=1962908 RepID=UPI00391FAC31|nr:aminotransferase class I/II-fold pyridoxal phosphate-dependent enzyme [Gemmatimonadota bacterium]
MDAQAHLLPSRREFAGDDLIFTLNGRAQKRAAEGVPVINATIGALYDDTGTLVVLDTVMAQWQQLTSAEIAPYAPIGGDPTYLLNLVQRHWPALTSVGVGVATPGGSGALALTLKNLLERGQTVLTVAPYWGPYSTLAVEAGMSLATVPYPDVHTGLDLGAWEAACRDLLDAQGRLVLWLNDPCHNPTGRSFAAADRRALMDMLRDVSSQGPVTLILDLAYLDYARDPREVRAALDEYAAFAAEGAVLVGACLSLSKAYTLYGARAGALVFPWSTDRALQAALVTSCRGTWSNCARGPMSVLNRISKDPALQARLEAEHAQWRTLLAERAQALDAALKGEGLAGCAYDGGFFVTLDGGADPFATCERLQQRDVFVVPMPEGLRVGICAMKASDAPRFAAAYRASR